MNVTAKRVVIIDDEPAMLKLLHHVCEVAGYSIEMTSSPEDFRRLVLSRPDFILMDLLMPGVDGVELFRYLAENQIRAGIVLISGTDARVVQSAARLAAAQGLNIQGTLGKPFEIAELQKILARGSENLPEREHAEGDAVHPSDLAAAIKEGTLTAYFQPQVDLMSNRVIGCEALVRWNHSEWGLVFPDRFIPVAEQAGLMPALTDCVAGQALRESAALAKLGIKIQCSINVSAISLAEIQFPDRLIKLAEQERVAPEAIVVEVTESQLFEDSVNTIDVLTRLRMKGFELSIDDFGTGYSTLRQLQLIPFNELKIDKQFVMNCETNRESESIVRTSIELGQRLGLRTVAEGVESLRIAELLRGWGCTVGQGYAYSKALPSPAFLTWLQNRENRGLR